MRLINYLLIIVLLFSWCIVKGEEGLTLEQAIDIAMKQNPEILSAKGELNVSLGKRLQMEAIPDPEIAFSDEGIPMGGISRNGTEREISFGIQQFLEFPGKRSLRGKIGKYGEEISFFELERIEIIIKAGVKRAYYKAILSQRTISTLESTLGLLDEFIDNANIKYQVGMVPYLDVLRARVEKARIQNQLIEVKKELKVDKSYLNLLLGRKGDEPLHLLTDISFIPFEKDFSKIKEEAKRTRPSLYIAALKLEQANAGLRLSNMSFYPDFSVEFFFPSLRTGAGGVVFGFSIPVYWKKRQKGLILEAEATKQINLISSEAIERRIMTQLENAYSSVKAAEEQVKVFEQKLLREAEDQLKIGIHNYQYGKIDALNLLDLYRTYTLTKLEYLRSLYFYLVSLADLEVAGEDYE
ncbi:MAG: TolC family protein [Acidobacteriota bacterium]